MTCSEMNKLQSCEVWSVFLCLNIRHDFCADIRILSVNVEKNIHDIEVLFTP